MWNERLLGFYISVGEVIKKQEGFLEDDFVVFRVIIELKYLYQDLLEPQSKHVVLCLAEKLLCREPLEKTRENFVQDVREFLDSELVKLLAIIFSLVFLGSVIKQNLIDLFTQSCNRNDLHVVGMNISVEVFYDLELVKPNEYLKVLEFL
jgi:hypothetical protein